MALPKHIKCIITYANYLKDGWKKEGAVAVVHLMTVLPKVNAWHLAEKKMKPEILWQKFGIHKEFGKRSVRMPKHIQITL